MNGKVIDAANIDIIKNTTEMSTIYEYIRLTDEKGKDVFWIKFENVITASNDIAMLPGGLFKKLKPVPAVKVVYLDDKQTEQSILFVPNKPDEGKRFVSSVDKDLQRYKYVLEKKKAFAATLSSIPKAIVKTDGEHGKVRSSVEFINGLKMSSITARSAYSMLGDFVVIDVETCGLAVTDPILEIAAIRFEAYKPNEIFTTLINPGKKIPEEITEINHITDDMVDGAPTIWQVMPSLGDFVGGLPIVGHNIPFDLKFLYRYGFDLKPKQKVFDTLPLSRKVFKKNEVSDYSLESIIRECGVYPQTHHRGADDALATGILFKLIAEELASDV